MWPRFSEQGNLSAAHRKKENAQSRNLESVYQVLFQKLTLLLIFLFIKTQSPWTAVTSLSSSFKACVDISNL
jgi:hypothetical protein